MRDVQKLRELLERVEKAIGPDWELSRDLSIFAGTRSRDPQTNEALTGEGPAQYTYVDYTGSLDASIALVERMFPGGGWAVEKYGLTCQGEILIDGEVDTSSVGPTPPLAVLSALLRALISQAESTRAEAHKMEGGSGLFSCASQAEGEGA